jgi:hypothetical protein
VARKKILTEADWLSARAPGRLLDRLRDASKRKLRLLACACARQVWDRLEDVRSREAVLAAEGYADGLLGRKGLIKFRDEAFHVGVGTRGRAYLAWVVSWTESIEPDFLDWTVAQRATQAAPGAGVKQTAVCALIREVFGNPYRPPVIPAGWLQWNGGTVAALGRTIYDERSFTHLPVLADALEEAGCDDADLLAHCRRPDGHVRGCWALDAVRSADGGPS